MIFVSNKLHVKLYPLLFYLLLYYTVGEKNIEPPQKQANGEQSNNLFLLFSIAPWKGNQSFLHFW